MPTLRRPLHTSGHQPLQSHAGSACCDACFDRSAQSWGASTVVSASFAGRFALAQAVAA